MGQRLTLIIMLVLGMEVYIYTLVQSQGQVLRHVSRCHGAQVYMQSKYVGNKHRHVWLSRNPDPEFLLASRPARSLGWQVGLVGWLVTWFVVYLLGWFGCLVGLLFGWPAGWWMVWLATWLEGGGLEVGTFLLLVGMVGWLPVLAGWFGSTRQRLVPSPGALTEGSGRGPGFGLLEKQEKQFPLFMLSFGLSPRAFAWKGRVLASFCPCNFEKKQQKHRESANISRRSCARSG